jgi:hypothetical protein
MDLFLVLGSAICLTSICCLLPLWRHRKVPWSISLLGGLTSALVENYYARWAFASGRMPEPKSGVSNAVEFRTFILGVLGLVVSIYVVRWFRKPVKEHRYDA